MPPPRYIISPYLRRLNLENIIIVAVKGIITFDKKILVIQRSMEDEVGANTWEFAGGKLDFGENLETALKREIKEEVGLCVAVGRLLYATTFKTHEHRQLVVLSYLCYAHDDTIVLSSEHQKYAWVNKEQLMGLLHEPIINNLNAHSVWDYL